MTEHSTSFHQRRRRRDEKGPLHHENGKAESQHHSIYLIRDDDKNKNPLYDDLNKGHRSYDTSMARIFKNMRTKAMEFSLHLSKLWHSKQKSKRRLSFHDGSSRKREQWLFRLLLWTVATNISLAIYRYYRMDNIGYISMERPLTDDVLDRIPLTISIFDRTEAIRNDIGGWEALYLNYRFVSPPINETFGHQIAVHPDYSNLEMKFMTETSSKSMASPRTIRSKDKDVKMVEKAWEKSRSVGHHIHSYFEHPEDIQDISTNKTCRYPNWVMHYHPSCNSIHEGATVVRKYDPERAKLPGDDQIYDSWYVGHGSFRETFLMKDPHTLEQSAVKFTRIKNAAFYQETLAMVQLDATVMEHLRPSPRIVDLYGHCGGTVWVEPMPGDVDEMLGRFEEQGYYTEVNLTELPLEPNNEIPLDEKIDLAVTMAEAVADMHGYRGGVIGHDDMYLDQWLKNDAGQVKLGDFNRAKILMWNEAQKDYCKYDYSGRAWRFRAPEEYSDDDMLDHQIDVYVFGNTLYTLLTGRVPFYNLNSDHGDEVKEMVKNGTRPFLDPRWKNRSYAEGKLVQIIQKCWRQDPTKRIEIFEAVRRLKEVQKEHKRRVKKGQQ